MTHAEALQEIAATTQRMIANPGLTAKDIELKISKLSQTERDTWGLALKFVKLPAEIQQRAIYEKWNMERIMEVALVPQQKGADPVA